MEKELAGKNLYLTPEAVIEGMLEAVVIVGLDGKILRVNSEFERGLGWKREEVIGKTPLELGITSKEDFQKIEKEVIPKLMKEGGVRDFETIATRRDGTKFPALMSWTLVRDAGGQPVGVIVVARDITELRHLQEKENEATKITATITDSMGDGLVLHDLEGKIVFVNPAFERMTGYTKSELLGKDLFTFPRKLIKPEDLEKTMKTVRTVLERKVPASVSLNYIRKDGKEIPVIITASFIKDAEGKPTTLITTVRDITELKLLQEKEREKAEIVDAMGDGLIVTDLDGNILFVNKAMEEYQAESGADAKNLVGKSVFNLPTARPENREKYLEIMKEAVKKGSVGALEFQDAAGRWGSITVSLLKDEKGNPSAIFAIRRDITELKRLQEKEREAEEEEMIRLSNAVKMSADSIVISDIDAKIIDVNEAALKIYGTDDRGDLIGKKSFDIIAPEDRERAFACMEELLERGYTKSQEYHVIIKDSGKIPLEMTTAVMKDRDGKPIGFVSISRDITRRKKMEEERAAADKELVEKMEKFARLTQGREMRITELERRVKELDKKLKR